jgi:hypothetical protein
MTDKRFLSSSVFGYQIARDSHFLSFEEPRGFLCDGDRKRSLFPWIQSVHARLSCVREVLGCSVSVHAGDVVSADVYRGSPQPIQRFPLKMTR